MQVTVISLEKHSSQNSERALKPYEEAVNAAAGTLALNDPTLLARRGTQKSLHQLIMQLV